MKKTTKLRISITTMMLIAAACVLLGESIMSFSGITLSFPYIEALFPIEGTSFRNTTVVYVWLVLVGGVVASALVWLRGTRAALVAGAVCLSSILCHVVASIINEYSVFAIDGIWAFLMLALPLASTVLCIVLYRAVKDE